MNFCSQHLQDTVVVSSSIRRIEVNMPFSERFQSKQDLVLNVALTFMSAQFGDDKIRTSLRTLCTSPLFTSHSTGVVI